jgi:hypothetical protein
MHEDEIKIKIWDAKIVPIFEYLSKNLAEDPEVVAGTNRSKTAMLKFANAKLAEIEEFFEDGELDDRDNQSDADVFGDDDIAVGPGRTTATGFMDPPDGADEFMDPDDDDGPDLDIGDGGYDDGFPK